MTITGGTYNNANGTATFVNNSGFSFNVTGFITGFTDNNTYVTGGTYSSGTTNLNTNSGTTVLITGYTDSPFSLINEGSGQGIVIRARNPLNYGAIGDLALILVILVMLRIQLERQVPPHLLKVPIR
jgi:hypothetical protein